MDGYTISLPCEPDGSGELKIHLQTLILELLNLNVFFFFVVV